MLRYRDTSPALSRHKGPFACALQELPPACFAGDGVQSFVVQNLLQNCFSAAAKNAVHPIPIHAGVSEVAVKDIFEAGLHEEGLRVRLGTKLEREIEVDVEMIAMVWIVITQHLREVEEQVCIDPEIEIPVARIVQHH